MSNFYWKCSLVLGALFTFNATACPLCHSTTAQDVRAGILATAQDSTVIAALLGPFLGLGLVLGIFHRIESIRESKRIN